MNWFKPLCIHYQQPPNKFWCEYEVDTYWTRHALIGGSSLNDAAAEFRRHNPGVSLSCIGTYRGPKQPGEALELLDEPYMEGYRHNGGKAKYFNGATPKFLTTK